jgi:hypothetical protein
MYVLQVYDILELKMPITIVCRKWAKIAENSDQNSDLAG